MSGDYGWRRGKRRVNDTPRISKKQGDILTQASAGLEAIGAFRLTCIEDGCDGRGVIIAIDFGSGMISAGASCLEHLQIACAKAQALGVLVVKLSEGEKNAVIEEVKKNG